MGMKQKVVTSTVCSVMAVLAIVFGQSTVLKTSEQGLAHVANQEGCRLAAYQCSANKWTAGLGHTKGIKKNAQNHPRTSGRLFHSRCGHR